MLIWSELAAWRCKVVLRSHAVSGTMTLMSRVLLGV